MVFSLISTYKDMRWLNQELITSRCSSGIIGMNSIKVILNLFPFTDSIHMIVIGAIEISSKSLRNVSKLVDSYIA